MNFIQKCLTKEKKLKNTTWRGPNQLMYFVGFLTVPALLFVIIFCIVLKQVAKMLMFFYHGTKFKGFLSLSDMYWAHETNECKSIVTFIIFISSSERVEIYEKIKQRLKERVYDRPKDYPKLTSTKHKFMGYTYLLENNYPMENVLKKLETKNGNDKVTEQEYREIVTEKGFQPLPDKGLWEIFVSEKPIVTEEETKFLYPVLFRIHHLVGDGVSLLALGTKLWGDEFPDLIVNRINKENDNSGRGKRFFTSVVRIIKGICHFIYLFYIWMGSAYWIQHIKEKDLNALHGPKLSGEKIATWYREDKVELVPLIKKVKNSVYKGAFSDVIYTALSASFTDYFKKKSQPIPPTFTLLNAMIYSSRNISNKGPAVLENNTCFSFFAIPTVTNSLHDTLIKIGELSRQMKVEPSKEINLWSLRFLVGVFPEPLLAMVTYMGGVTTAVSNLPGGAKFTALGGYEAHVLFFALTRYRTGVACSFMTYNDRFNIGLAVDKVLVNNREDAEAILQDFVKNLRLLNEEIELKNGTQKVMDADELRLTVTHL